MRVPPTSTAATTSHSSAMPYSVGAAEGRTTDRVRCRGWSGSRSCRRALASDIRATGARLLDAGPEPLATLVLCQRLAVELAVARGFDPDAPRNLTRSVVLS